MKNIEINPKLFGDTNQEFKYRFEKDLDICELSEETKKGFLFLLGAYLPGMLTNKFGKDEEAFFENISILGLYSKSTCDFSDYGELNDEIFTYWIYNTNTLLSQISEPDSSIDEYLKNILNTDIKIGKTPLNTEFINEYKNGEFNLNLIQNINDRFFTEIGKELVGKGFSSERSYEAGMAYRIMMMQMDIKGTQFLIDMLTSNLTLSPLYRTLLNMPILFHTNKQAFCGNHLFSQVLNTFIGGERSLVSIYVPIHKYHQYLFYKEGTTEIRDEWQFEKHINIGSGIPIYINSIGIRNTVLVEAYKKQINISEVYDKTVIERQVTKDELLNMVLEIVKDKYGINGYSEFTNEKSEWNDGFWNNKGEYIQFLVALYYETCLHTMMAKKID